MSWLLVLHMCILAPVRHPDLVKSLGLSNAPGVLLAGPPGCGKILLAKVRIISTGCGKPRTNTGKICYSFFYDWEVTEFFLPFRNSH